MTKVEQMVGTTAEDVIAESTPATNTATNYPPPAIRVNARRIGAQGSLI